MPDYESISYCFPNIKTFLNIVNNSQVYSLCVNKKNILLYNRYYISDQHGIKFLTVPVKKIRGIKNFFDIEIDNSKPWQKIHFNAIKTAYGKTPYFHFYENDLWNIFKEKYNKLSEFNKEALRFINHSLGQEGSLYMNLKVNEIKLPEYKNHFGVKIVEYHNLSILEFLFRFGPIGIFEILI